MNSFDEVFAQVKSYITEHELISDVARDTWIETMSPVELDGQDAVFEVDTGFQQGIIQNNYKAMLEKVLEEVMGFPVNLVVHVVVPIEKQMEPTPHIPISTNSRKRTQSFRSSLSSQSMTIRSTPSWSEDPMNLPMLHAKPLHRMQAPTITPCSSTVRRVWARPTS